MASSGNGYGQHIFPKAGMRQFRIRRARLSPLSWFCDQILFRSIDQAAWWARYFKRRGIFENVSKVQAQVDKLWDRTLQWSNSGHDNSKERMKTSIIMIISRRTAVMTCLRRLSIICSTTRLCLLERIGGRFFQNFAASLTAGMSNEEFDDMFSKTLQAIRYLFALRPYENLYSWYLYDQRRYY